MSIDRIREILSKQKVVEGMLHGSHLPRQAIVETLVQRQHRTELESLLAAHPPEEIGALLEELPEGDARLLWDLVPAERENDILWELSDQRREQLAGDREPRFADSQMNAFELVDGRLRQTPILGRRDLEKLDPVWIDLLNVTRAERTFIGRHFGIDLPDPGESTDLEVSTRFHVDENNDLHLHSNFLLGRADESRSVAVAFVIHKGTLFSLRNEDLPVFRLQRQRARLMQDYVADCRDLLIDLYGADVEYSADALEETYATLAKVGRQVLSESISDQEAAAILGEIAEEEDQNGRIRGNILDTHRALNFIVRSRTLSTNQVEDVRQILQNVDSLNSHTSFLFGKINFLMDATVGFININQNRRINQLTIFGVVFMPINILAGIGGMSEFSMMTQGMPWPLAYGLFSIGAALVGWFTYVLLRHFERRRITKRRSFAAD